MVRIGDTYYNPREFYLLNRGKNIKPVDKVLTETLKQLGIYDKILQAKIEKIWQQIVGETAARYTAELRLINNRLYIKIVSAALRQNLSMQRSFILSQVNQKLNAQIEDIVIY